MWTLLITGKPNGTEEAIYAVPSKRRSVLHSSGSVPQERKLSALSGGGSIRAGSNRRETVKTKAPEPPPARPPSYRTATSRVDEFSGYFPLT